MNLADLQSKLKEAASRHERLTKHVESERGQPGIRRLRGLLRQAAKDRMEAERDYAAAREALSE